MLTACYDRAAAPFDVIHFLLRAEAERIKRHERDLRIVVRPGADFGFGRIKFWPPELKQRRALLGRVILPMCAMLPSAASVVLDEQETIAAVAPMFGQGQLFIGLKAFTEALPVTGRCLRPIEKDAAKDQRRVTITLRESDTWPSRNSNTAEWLKAAAVIAGMGFHVVFVRDTAKAAQTLNAFPINIEAAVDLDVRARLYRSSFCNLFVSNGPAWLAIALDAPVLLFKPSDEKAGRCSRADYLASEGLPVGSQLPDMPAHQAIVWAPDDAPEIVHAFQRFVAAQSSQAA